MYINKIVTVGLVITNLRGFYGMPSGTDEQKTPGFWYPETFQRAQENPNEESTHFIPISNTPAQETNPSSTSDQQTFYQNMPYTQTLSGIESDTELFDRIFPSSTSVFYDPNSPPGEVDEKTFQEIPPAATIRPDALSIDKSKQHDEFTWTPFSGLDTQVFRSLLEPKQSSERRSNTSRLHPIDQSIQKSADIFAKPVSEAPSFSIFQNELQETGRTSGFVPQSRANENNSVPTFQQKKITGPPDFEEFLPHSKKNIEEKVGIRTSSTLKPIYREFIPQYKRNIHTHQSSEQKLYQPRSLTDEAGPSDDFSWTALSGIDIETPSLVRESTSPNHPMSYVTNSPDQQTQLPEHPFPTRKNDTSKLEPNSRTWPPTASSFTEFTPPNRKNVEEKIANMEMYPSSASIFRGSDREKINTDETLTSEPAYANFIPQYTGKVIPSSYDPTFYPISESSSWTAFSGLGNPEALWSQNKQDPEESLFANLYPEIPSSTSPVNEPAQNAMEELSKRVSDASLFTTFHNNPPELKEDATVSQTSKHSKLKPTSKEFVPRSLQERKTYPNFEHFLRNEEQLRSEEGVSNKETYLDAESTFGKSIPQSRRSEGEGISSMRSTFGGGEHKASKGIWEGHGEDVDRKVAQNIPHKSIYQNQPNFQLHQQQPTRRTSFSTQYYKDSQTQETEFPEADTNVLASNFTSQSSKDPWKKNSSVNPVYKEPVHQPIIEELAQRLTDHLAPWASTSNETNFFEKQYKETNIVPQNEKGRQKKIAMFLGNVKPIKSVRSQPDNNTLRKLPTSFSKHESQTLQISPVIQESVQSTQTSAPTELPGKNSLVSGPAYSYEASYTDNSKKFTSEQLQSSKFQFSETRVGVDTNASGPNASNFSASRRVEPEGKREEKLFTRGKTTTSVTSPYLQVLDTKQFVPKSENKEAENFPDFFSSNVDSEVHWPTLVSKPSSSKKADISATKQTKQLDEQIPDKQSLTTNNRKSHNSLKFASSHKPHTFSEIMHQTKEKEKIAAHNLADEDEDVFSLMQEMEESWPTLPSHQKATTRSTFGEKKQNTPTISPSTSFKEIVNQNKRTEEPKKISPKKDTGDPLSLLTRETVPGDPLSPSIEETVPSKIPLRIPSFKEILDQRREIERQNNAQAALSEIQSTVTSTLKIKGENTEDLPISSVEVGIVTSKMPSRLPSFKEIISLGKAKEDKMISIESSVIPDIESTVEEIVGSTIKEVVGLEKVKEDENTPKPKMTDKVDNTDAESASFKSDTPLSKSPPSPPVLSFSEIVRRNAGKEVQNIPPRIPIMTRTSERTKGKGKLIHKDAEKINTRSRNHPEIPFERCALIIPKRLKARIDVLKEIESLNVDFKCTDVKLFRTGAVLVMCKSEAEANKLRKAVEKSNTLTLKNERLFPREVQIPDVPKETLDSEIYREIFSTFKENPVNVRFVYDNDKKKSDTKLAVVEVGDLLVEKMKASPTIKIRSQELKIDTSVKVDRCEICKLLGHKAKYCEGSRRSVPLHSEPCLDCTYHNKMDKKAGLTGNRNVNHPTDDDKCPTKQYYVKKWERNQRKSEMRRKQTPTEEEFPSELLEKEEILVPTKEEFHSAYNSSDMKDMESGSEDLSFDGTDDSDETIYSTPSEGGS